MNIEISINLISLITLFIAAFAIPIIFLLVIGHRGNPYANAWLVALLSFSFLFALMLVALQEFKEFLDIEWLALFDLQLLIGPLVYFYIRELLVIPRQRKSIILLHAIPAIGGILIWFFQLPLTESDWLVTPCLADQECSLTTRARFSHRFVTHISIILYALASLKLVRSYQKQIQANFSALEGINLDWLSRMLFVMLALSSSIILIEIYRFFGKEFVVSGAQLGGLVLFFGSMFLGILGANQRAIPVNRGDESESKTDKRAEPEHVDTSENKHYTSSLTDEGASQIFQLLEKCMIEKRPHLEHGLKISQLAKLMDVPSKHLSETINGYSNQSFYDFINSYRVEEASRLLKDPDALHLSMSDIGYQAGFNSNSTFFQQFKRRKAQTPKQFRRESQKT